MTKREKLNAMVGKAETLSCFRVEKFEPMRPGSEFHHIILETTAEDTATFAMLDEVSKLFDTKKINISAGERQGGYCETCAYTEQYIQLDIQDATV